MGPTKLMGGGSCWPKRSSSPGPETPQDGRAAPTFTTCPAVRTSCIGVRVNPAARERIAISSVSTVTVINRADRLANRRRGLGLIAVISGFVDT